MMKKIILTSSLVLSAHSWAKVEFNSPKILARSNVRDSYNLPTLSYLSNVAPVINNQGEITFKVIATGEEGLQGIWVKAHNDENGKIQYIAPEEKVVTDPSINDQGMIAFSLFDDVKADGLFTLDSQSLKVTQVYNSSKSNINFFTYPTMTNSGDIIFRGTDKNNDRKIYRYSADKKLTPLLSEGVDISGNTGSYIFRPVINNSGNIAFKMRLGERGNWDEKNPDIIALYGDNFDRDTDVKGMDLGAKGGIKVLAYDHDYNQSSNYTAFLNTVSLSNEGHIGFVGLHDDGRMQVIIQNAKNESKIVATENEGEVLNVELFSVKVNKQGHLIFRGKNKEGKRTIFFYDGSELNKVVSEGDEVPTDLGASRILDNQNYPGFSGEIDFNDNDEIVFTAIVRDARDNHEQGTAVFTISRKN